MRDEKFLLEAGVQVAQFAIDRLALRAQEALALKEQRQQLQEQVLFLPSATRLLDEGEKHFFRRGERRPAFRRLGFVLGLAVPTPEHFSRRLPLARLGFAQVGSLQAFRSAKYDAGDLFPRRKGLAGDERCP